MPTIRAAGPPPDSAVTERAQFTARRTTPATAVVSVDGELDAANVSEFADFTFAHARRSGQLVLDLSDVSFFGTACFAALHILSVRFTGEGIDWVMVPARAVFRVLRICDPNSRLPTAASTEAALAMLRANPPVWQLGQQPAEHQ